MDVKLNRELNKALNNLKAREWDMKQLGARQDKTMVEHVPVLEKAKRVTDKLFSEAQLKLMKRAAHLLEESKVRLSSEDLFRDYEKEPTEMHARAEAM